MEFILSSFYAFLYTQTTNKRNKMTVIAEPLDEGLAEKLETGKINLDWDKKKVRQ